MSLVFGLWSFEASDDPTKDKRLETKDPTVLP
jgi:hypothetical protein